MIGGALAKPVETMPFLFSPGSIWDQFPYLLPNVFSAGCVFIGVSIGVLFLQETHIEKKWRRDPGLELGDRLLSRMPWRRQGNESKGKGKAPEEQPLLGESDEPLPGYLTTEQAPGSQEPLHLEESGQVKVEKKPVISIFSWTSIQIIITFGILAL